MRVLIYETGQIGHRPIYRNYYKSALEQCGVTVEMHTTPVYARHFGFNQYLQSVAEKRGCDLIHLLTLDDHTRRLFLSHPASQASSQKPVVGTYYLYQNIVHCLKGWGIRHLFKQGKINALIVPSLMQLLSPQIMSVLPIQVYPLPDPEPPNELGVGSKPDSLKALGISQDWARMKIVLVFGVLNKRRGVDQIVRMIEEKINITSGIRFIFAGRIDRESIGGKVVDSLIRLDKAGNAKVIDRWISSYEVALLYHIADVFCIMPHKKFLGGNSTVAQALKAGLTVVAPEDSIAGKCAAYYDRAVLFRRGDSYDFLRSLREAGAKERNNHSPERPGKDISLSVGIRDFGHLLVSAYNSVYSRFSNRDLV